MAGRRWILKGYDTFSHHSYPIGRFRTRRGVRVAAWIHFHKLELSQPTETSGGQKGIQDRMTIIAPDGSSSAYAPEGHLGRRIIIALRRRVSMGGAFVIAAILLGLAVAIPIMSSSGASEPGLAAALALPVFTILACAVFCLAFRLPRSLPRVRSRPRNIEKE